MVDTEITRAVLQAPYHETKHLFKQIKMIGNIKPLDVFLPLKVEPVKMHQKFLELGSKTNFY